MAYEIIQKLISMNRSHEALNAIGMVVHETADNGATAEQEQNAFNTRDRQASAHAFVDWDSIVQTVPFSEVAWHAGRTANHKFIGIELCHATDASKFNEVWNRGVWLFAYVFVNVLHINTITKDNLMSHEEVSLKWHETTHVDPKAYFAQYGKTIDDFRNAVQEEINNMIKPNSPTIKYQAHVQSIGWQPFFSNGEDAGTTGKGLRMEALAIDSDIDLNIEAHIQGIGWQSARHNGEIVGTVGLSKRIEAIKITLNDPNHHVQYQAHVQGIGWQDWVQDGAVAGTTGQSLRLEAIRIKIV